MNKSWIKKSMHVEFNLESVLSILKRNKEFSELETRKIPTNIVDEFLFSGRFNSTLGLDGFTNFKIKLKDVLKKVNSDEFGLNYINLDSMYGALISSGIYYTEESLPEDLKELKTDTRWLTSYRYIAKNFPDINYKDFREIVKRFKDSDGHSFYISKDGSKGLQEVASHKELFRELADTKAALLQMGQKELRAICEEIGVKSARTIDETVDRIVATVGDGALKYVSKELLERRTLFIKDTELANGNDLINLDSYLRNIAKVVRQDLTNFIDQRRHWSLLSKERKAA